MEQNFNSIWQQCLIHIKKKVDTSCFKTWFKPIKPISYNYPTLRVEVPNKFVYEWIEKYYSGIVTHSIKYAIGEKARLFYVIKPNNVPVHSLKTNINLPSQKNITSSPISNQQTFDHFIAEKNCPNFYVKKLLISILQDWNQGDSIMLRGKSGIGKSHLLAAVVHLARKKIGKKILYTRAEDFTKKCIFYFKNKKINFFIEEMTKVDLWAFDNITFLENKYKIQNIFLQLFEYLHKSQKKIIIASNLPFAQLKNIDYQIKSRLSESRTVIVLPPHLSSRKTIIKEKCTRYGITLSPEIIDYIASKINTNMYALQGILLSLVDLIKLGHCKIDQKLIEKIVGEYDVQQEKKKITASECQKAVAHFYKLPLEKILDNSRQREFVHARHVAIYIIHLHLKLPLQKIVSLFRQRNHSIAIYAHRKISKMLTYDSRLKSDIKEIEKNLHRHI